MAGAGQEVCVAVTHLDGLVCARSVFNHSLNYRSAMIYGVARLLTDPDEVAARVLPPRLEEVVEVAPSEEGEEEEGGEEAASGAPSAAGDEADTTEG
jgi:nitroimidazol reductase NimA-like FMN-containing flavoprotein (pyridoxamine 5'-phosphate oxidase superfamily)